MTGNELAELLAAVRSDFPSCEAGFALAVETEPLNVDCRYPLAMTGWKAPRLARLAPATDAAGGGPSIAWIEAVHQNGKYYIRNPGGQAFVYACTATWQRAGAPSPL